MDAVTITLNDTAVRVRPGASVLDAVLKARVALPHLCKDPDLPALGACRTCLVQVEGMRGFPASCTLPAHEGMRVRTDTPELHRIRRGVLELTVGMVQNGGRDHGELTVAAQAHGLDSGRFAGRPRQPTDRSGIFFDIDLADCILCGRCTSGCGPGHQFIGAITIAGGAQGARITTFNDDPLIDSICTSCGTCLSVCPTGAIRPKEPLPPAARVVDSTCPYCGVGCGVKLHVSAQDRIVLVDDAPENRSSVGLLCVKGRFGADYVHHPDRLTTPLIKEHGRFREASWDEALDLVADRFAQYRGRAFASIASAKATNEDGYVQQKFVRLVMGTNSIDHCTRLCHSPSVTAMLAALGSGATSNSYTDYEDAGCLVLVGCDPSQNHPVVASRMRRAVVERGARLVVINPRRIEMCDYATYWLAPRPGTDVALFNGMAKVILDEGLWDPEFVAARTEGFEEWHRVVEGYDLERVAEVTGVPAEEIAGAARLYARPPFSGSCLVWGMGITQHTMGTANAHSVINLALLTGQLGVPGSGISPLRGQNNVQGCGDAGCIPESLPGYQGIGEEARARFGAAWGGALPAEPGLVITDMMEAMLAGEVRCAYIVGENPILSEPYMVHARRALERLEFLVYQDIFMHETAEMADVVLPACSFAEKEGTFTNSERRVQRVRRGIPPVGQSRPDWEIVCDLAGRVCRRLGLPAAPFEYDEPAAVFAEMARLTPILAGISHERLEREGGIQWPCPTPDHPGTPRLYAEDFPRGKGRFVAFEQGPLAAELPSRRYPLILNTGRILYHWHGGTITSRARGLLERSPELRVAIHPYDAEDAAIADGEWVRIVSRRGEVQARALVTDAQRPGELFVPFVRLAEHWANMITNPAYDPTSRIPEYKVSAVRLEKRDHPQRDGEEERGQRRGPKSAVARRSQAGQGSH